MARTAKLEPLRRLLDGTVALREALEEADRAEAFLAESKAAVTEAAERSNQARLAMAELENRRIRLAEEVEGERQRRMVPILAALKAEEDKVAAVRATLDPMRRSLEEDAARLRTEISTLRGQLQDAKRTQIAALQDLRQDTDRRKSEMQAEIDAMTGETARVKDALTQAQSELNGIVEAAGRIGRR